MLIVAVLIDLTCNYISHKAKRGETKVAIKNAVLPTEEVATDSDGFWRFQTRSQELAVLY